MGFNSGFKGLNVVYVRFCIFVTQARNKTGNLQQRITNRRISWKGIHEVQFIKLKAEGYVHKMHAVWNAHLITNCIRQKCLWKANGRLTCQEILHFFLYQKIFCHKILRGVTFITLSYVFLWVIPRRLNFICRRFGTLCLFHLHRQVGK